MSTARKNLLTRLVDNSVTDRVLETADVPVEIIVGDAVSKWESYGIPAAIGTAAVLMIFGADCGSYFFYGNGAGSASRTQLCKFRAASVAGSASAYD